VTLKLRPRNDLFKVLMDMMYHSGEGDLCIVECFMNEECVTPGSVFALGDRAHMIGLDVEDDVKRLTAVYSPKDAKGARATAARMVVRAESAELAGDVVTDLACAAVLGEKASKTPAGDHLMHVYCTDEAKARSSNTSHKKVLSGLRVKSLGFGGKGLGVRG